MKILLFFLLTFLVGYYATAANPAKFNQGIQSTNLSTGVVHSDSVGLFSSSTLVNADVSASAALARSKIAAGTVNRMCVNDPSTGALIDAAAITGSRALVSDSNGIPTHSTVTTTELQYASGVTSSLCGINQTCTLTAKTLTTPTVDIPLFDGQGSTPASPSSGFYKLYFKDSDGKPYFLNSSGTETQVGSGSGGGATQWLSLDFESDAGGVTAFDDGSVAVPVDGTGGSPGLTCARAADTNLKATGVLRITHDAADRKGEGCSVDFTVDKGYRGARASISFIYRVNSGTFAAGSSSASGDLDVYIYDKDNGVVIQPDRYRLTCSSSTSCAYYGEFQIDGVADDYRLILIDPQTTATAFTVDLDEVKIGTMNTAQGPPVTDWTAFTPTGNWVSNTTYTGFWRRVGDTMEITCKAVTSGAPTSAVFSCSLPSGYTIDSSKISTSQNSIYGVASAWDNGVSNHSGMVIYNTSTTVTAMTDGTGTAFWTQANPLTFGSGDEIKMMFKVPITGWGSNIQIGADNSEGRVVSANMYKNGGTQTISTNTSTAITLFGSSSEVLDDSHAGWSTASGYYLVPVSGRYKLCLRNVMSAAGDHYVQSIYKVNSGSYKIIGQGNGSTSFIATSFGCDEAKLVGGDTVTPGVVSSGTTLTGASFTIEKIQGPELPTSGEYDPARNKYAAKTANYTLVNSVDQTVTGDASGGAFTFTLPSALGRPGQEFTMIKSTASTGAITINTTSSQTIGTYASGTIKLDFLNERLVVVSDGANWQIKDWGYPNLEFAPTLSTTPSGWSTGINSATVKKTIDGTWRMAFNISGTMTAANSGQIIISNVVFNSAGYQALSLWDINPAGSYTIYGRVDPGGSSIFWATSANAGHIIISGDVKLNAKPGFSM